MIYLDYNATTPIEPAVAEAMQPFIYEQFGNPSSGHTVGRVASEAIAAARVSVASLIGASPDEIVFGPNMTTLTLGISRALAREIGPGDEIVVTRMDHDANISPWLLAAEDRGATVRWADFDVEDYTLDMAALRGLINENTKIVAVGYASNATGTVHDAFRNASGSGGVHDINWMVKRQLLEYNV